MYTVIYAKRVIKFLEKHPDLVRRFHKSLKLLQHWDIGTLDLKKLKGIDEHYRLRIGKYRFLFEKQDTEIVLYFYDADSRGDIY